MEAKALNADAQIILGDMDLKDAKLDVAMYAIIGSMLEHGYLNELANSVLVTVDSRDSVKQAQLQQELAAQKKELQAAKNKENQYRNELSQV